MKDATITLEQDAEMLADDTQFLTECLSVEPAVDNSQRIEQDVEMPADDTLSLAERHPRWMNRRLPACYRNILPQPPPRLWQYQTFHHLHQNKHLPQSR